MTRQEERVNCRRGGHAEAKGARHPSAGFGLPFLGQLATRFVQFAPSVFAHKGNSLTSPEPKT